MDIRRRMLFNTDIDIYAIYYTSSNGKVVTPYKTNSFGASIVSNNCVDGQGIISFDGPITTIGDRAFYGCSKLASVNIPDSVTKIGDLAFYDCNLTSVNIPNSVTAIGKQAFWSCNNLASVNFGDSVTTIGNEAFRDCDRVTSVNIPNSVTTIGEAAFNSCDSLTSVTIGNSVTTIGNSAFKNCPSLIEFNGKFAADGGRSLIMDNTIIAYANASGTTYTISDIVTTIGVGAFGGCSKLTSVTIPDSVKTIGNYAFQACTSLTSVYCKATIPPALGSSYVFSSNGSDRKIYVPSGSVDAYKSATRWSSYADAIEGYNFN